jgi:hypothetical protein
VVWRLSLRITPVNAAEDLFRGRRGCYGFPWDLLFNHLQLVHLWVFSPSFTKTHCLASVVSGSSWLIQMFHFNHSCSWETSGALFIHHDSHFICLPVWFLFGTFTVSQFIPSTPFFEGAVLHIFAHALFKNTAIGCVLGPFSLRFPLRSMFRTVPPLYLDIACQVFLYDLLVELSFAPLGPVSFYLLVTYGLSTCRSLHACCVAGFVGFGGRQVPFGFALLKG